MRSIKINSNRFLFGHFRVSNCFSGMLSDLKPIQLSCEEESFRASFLGLNMQHFYFEHDADMSVAAAPYTIEVPYGIFDLDGRNIKGVLEKPTYNYFANAGIYLLKRSIIDSIPEGEFYNATDLMNSLISSGHKVVRFPIAGYWIDIGNKEELAKAQELVKHTSL